jgi:hypothetical protein
MAIFVATLVFALVARPLRPQGVRLKRFVIDLMGGIVLPGLCVLASLTGTPAVVASLVLPAIAVQMLTLFAWLLFRSRLGRLSALFAGILSVGAMVSGMIGAVAFFPSIPLLIYYGLGLLGFIPLLTFYAYLGSADEALRCAQAAGGDRPVWPLFVGGIVLAGALPVVIYVCAGPWIATVVEKVPWPWWGWPLTPRVP